MCHVPNKLQAWLGPGITWPQWRFLSPHFLALFLVLTSYASRPLSQLGELASSSRFLSYSFEILMEGKGLCMVMATKCLGKTLIVLVGVTCPSLDGLLSQKAGSLGSAKTESYAHPWNHGQSGIRMASQRKCGCCC